MKNLKLENITVLLIVVMAVVVALIGVIMLRTNIQVASVPSPDYYDRLRSECPLSQGGGGVPHQLRECVKVNSCLCRMMVVLRDINKMVL